MRKNEKGQSTIEFIFTFAFGVGIIFLIFNSAINYVTGYLVHYATFMASRTYLVADRYTGTISDTQSSLNGARQLAEETYNRYMLKMFNPDIGVTINEQGLSPEEYLTTGAITIFDMPMDLIGRIAGQSKLELVSESFLGKEPTRAQCANRVCYGITGATNCSNQMDITLYDDGC